MEENMDHSNHTRLIPDEISYETLAGAKIYGPDDAEVGSISHVHGQGNTAQVVVDVGGFLGIGAKPVALTASEIDLMRDETGAVHGIIRRTKDELKDLPEHVD
jgi:hypothetical protein